MAKKLKNWLIIHFIISAGFFPAISLSINRQIRIKRMNTQKAYKIITSLSFIYC